MQQALTPILHRLKELPFRADARIVEPMTLLRLAYSRERAGQSSLRSGLSAYCAVSAGRHRRGHPTSIGSIWLKAIYSTAVISPARTRAANAVRHACMSMRPVPDAAAPTWPTKCLSIIIAADAKSRNPISSRAISWFVPSVVAALHHLGIDYGKPGKIVRCRSCGAVNSEPLVNFVCLDCSTVTPAERATDDRLVPLRSHRKRRSHPSRRPAAPIRARSPIQINAARLFAARVPTARRP